MIQNVSSNAAANAAAASKAVNKQQAQNAVSQKAPQEKTITKKAVPSVAELNAEAFLQRQQIGAALYDRSFTLGEGKSALKRQDAIQAYAEQIQLQEGGPTDKDLRRLARKLEKAEARIEKLSNNDRGANLSSIEGIDGKELDTVQDNLAARIRHGLKDGSLTTEEGEALLTRQQELNDVETKLRASDGKLTAGEQKQLLDELRKTADEINRARSNGTGLSLGSYNYAADVDKRQADLEKQLEQGIKLGSLTADEADAVRAEFDKVNELEATSLANGRVDWRESVKLSNAMNEAEIKLYDLQRNSNGLKLAEAYVDVKYVDQRQAQQLEGITRGIDNGALTNDEGITLLEDQQAIQSIENKLVKDGLTRGEYLRLQTEMNEFSLESADLHGNKDRWTGIFPTTPATPAPVAPPVPPAPSTPLAEGSGNSGNGSAGTAAVPPASQPAASGPSSKPEAAATLVSKPAADGKPAVVEKPAAEAKETEAVSEPAPSTPQIQLRSESIKDIFGDLMTKAMGNLTSSIRSQHGDFLKQVAERREEADKASDRSRNGGERFEARGSDLDKSGFGSTESLFGLSRDADRDNKLRSYAAVADSASRSVPPIARKLA